MPSTALNHRLPAQSYRWIARATAVFVVAIGIVVILGWLFHIEVLKSILPIWVSMKANTALTFILSGCALWLVLMRSPVRATGLAVQIAGSIVLLSGLLTLGEYVLKLDLGIDQFFFHEPLGTVGTAYPGRMSLTTAFSFVLIGWSLLFFRKGGAWRVQAPALLANGIAFISITGYLYDAATLQQIGPQFTPVLAAITFIFLTAGILIGQPGSGVVRLLESSGPEGVLLRRLLPAVLGVPLLFGWLLLAGARFGFYSLTTGWALFALTTGVSLAIFTGRSAFYLRRADRSFHETLATLHSVLESVEAPVFSVDRAFRYMHFNRAHASVMKALYGVRISFGRSFLEYQAVEEDRAAARRSLERALRGEKLTESAFSGAPGPDQRFFEITHTPITGESGEILGVSVFAHDITVHKQAEELIRRVNVDLERSLQREKDLLETVINSLPDLVFVKDREGRFVLSNRALAEYAGLSDAKDLIGKTDREIVPAEIAEKYVEDDRKVFETGESVINAEELFAPAASGPRWLLTTKVPLRDESGRVSWIVGISRDITERKALEARMLQTQKLESLGVLAGGIAHDFNNILAIILGNAEIASQKLAPESAARKHVGEIAKASHRAADLCRQMLAYSGMGRFDVQPLDLSEVIDEMREMLRVGVSKKSSLRLVLEPALPAVEADVAQLRQVVMNLVMNASEAIGETGGLITVVTGAIDCDRAYLDSAWAGKPLPEGRYVSLVVEDSGCGMDEATRSRIFEPFFTTKFIGRGLGLSAVMGIVRSHGGAIRVFSEPGRGSTFKLLFPASSSLPRSLNPHQGGGKWKGHGTILLVDDEEGLRKVGREMLEGLGFTVLTAADGSEALDAYRAHADEIVCVLLDLTMPKMDGEETFQEMRAANPNVKVLLCSGYNEMQATQQFPGKGLAGFVQKPYRQAALESKLHQILGE